MEGPGPYPVAELRPLEGVGFSIEPDDAAFVRGRGGQERAYQALAADAWRDHPDHMDFLDPESPIHDLKQLERGLYLHGWAPALAEADVVLDVGCGVGRFAQWALERGKDVHGVDADLRSLQRLVWRAPSWGGRLDVHWSSVHQLPEVQADAVIACEVYCYVPDDRGALAHLATRLRPGGTLCLSVEARWGWATAEDVTPGTVGHALVGDGVVEGEDGSWVRTYEADDLVARLEEAGFDVEQVIPHHYVLDGPLERSAPPSLSLEVLLDLEEAAAAHPVWRPLNRIWSVIARRRG